MSVDPYSAPGAQPATAAPTQAAAPPAVPTSIPAYAGEPYQPSPTQAAAPAAVSYDHPSSEYPTAHAGNFSADTVSSSFRTSDKNWFGTVALVAAFFLPPAAIVFGHLSLSAAKKGEADNRGLGLAGLVLGYAVTATGIVLGVGLLLSA